MTRAIVKVGGSMAAQKKARKPRQEKSNKVKIDTDEAFSPANAKDKDFDLDLDAARFQGKKGQAGTRTKAVS